MPERQNLSPTHPVPHTQIWGWQRLARCRYLDPDVFFPAEDEGKGPRVRRERAARQICLGCPVRIACRDHALAFGETHGFWGGTSASERRDLTRRSRQITPR